MIKRLQVFQDGTDVVKLQKALVKAGFSFEVDSFFGNDTDVAVRQFQQKKRYHC
ncbi:peptidoglycan-binding domain-containing protein [Nostoc sp.]|uniref:peptidoglycan-binding domain-containing protein n=1 Tax=Nostoc sp. TaxID=1180 RepID=UPI002FFD18D9